MTASSAATAQHIAEASRDAMLKDDHATRSLGIRIESVGPGTCTATMTVRQDMLNGHAICHGGLITTLADSAFAFACNAYNEITLLAAARLGDVLTARAVEVSKSGRTGVYDISVTSQKGEAIAAFRGRSYTMKGKPLVDGLPMGKQR